MRGFAMADDLVSRLDMAAAHFSSQSRPTLYHACVARILALEARIIELEVALRDCSAPFDSGLTTVMGGASSVACEFARRQQAASDALCGLKGDLGD